MLTIKNLYKKFDSVLALQGLCMEIEKGDIYGFIGPNGAGKTTTLKIIAGILKPTDGEIWFDGKRVEHTVKDLKKDIGYLPDSFGVYDNLDIGEYLEFFASAYGIHGKECKKRIGEVLDLVDLTGPRPGDSSRGCEPLRWRKNQRADHGTDHASRASHARRGYARPRGHHALPRPHALLPPHAWPVRA